MTDLPRVERPQAAVPSLPVARTSAPRERDQGARLRGAAHKRAVLNQAKGLVMAYLHVDAEAAFELLRDWAKVRSETLSVIAEDLVRAACVTSRSRSWDPEVFRLILTAMAHPESADAAGDGDDPPVAVSVEFAESPPVVRVAGNLTAVTVPVVLEALELAARRVRPDEVVMVDLSGLSHRRRGSMGIR